MSFRVVVEAYSLAEGEVGKPIDGSRVVTVHANGVDALLALDGAIQNHHQAPGQGLRYQMQMPDGRLVAFDAAYTEIFGEAPVKRDNQLNLYPRLNSGNSKSVSRPRGRSGMQI